MIRVRTTERRVFAGIAATILASGIAIGVVAGAVIWTAEALCGWVRAS